MKKSETKKGPGRQPDGIERIKVGMKVHRVAWDEFKRRAGGNTGDKSALFNRTFTPRQRKV